MPQRWENYVVLADAQPDLEGRTTLEVSETASTGGCCGTGAAHEQSGGKASAATCC